MTIGVEVRALSPFTPTGIGRYIHNVLKRFPKNVKVVLYSSLDFDWTIYPSQIKFRRKLPYIHWHIWANTVLRTFVKKDEIDIYYGTSNTIPLTLPKNVKKILVLHDLYQFQLIAQLKFAYLRSFGATKEILGALAFRLPSIYVADLIIAVSKSTAESIIKMFKISPQKIRVIYSGIDFDMFHQASDKEKQEFIKKYSIKTPYILMVGIFTLHRNYKRAIQAFYHLQNNLSFFLVIVGKGGTEEGVVKRLIKKLGLEDKVYLVGRVSEDELRALYSNASLYVNVNLMEGFGFPALEAMACGCPVVVSKVGSLPEVCGEAGFYVNPYDTLEIANGIKKVLTDKNLREEMIKKGFERAKELRWEKTVKELLEVFDEVHAKSTTHMVERNTYS